MPDHISSPPQQLQNEVVMLRFREFKSGGLDSEHVPFYHFRIQRVPDRVDVGHINFRIGDTRHILYCAGHIGYGVDEPYRGNSYAYHACRAIAPFVKTIYPSVILTVSPFNKASLRTIEKLGCGFIDEVPIDAVEEAYLNGERLKRRYRWDV